MLLIIAIILIVLQADTSPMIVKMIVKMVVLIEQRDTEAAHQINRRIELNITERLLLPSKK